MTNNRQQGKLISWKTIQGYVEVGIELGENFQQKVINIICEMMEKQTENRHTSNRRQFSSYEKVTAYTRKPSYEQLITILLFTTVLTLHSIFITPAISQQSSSILWIMLGSSYLLLIVIVYDYLYLTCTDPVDSLLLGNQLTGKRADQVRQCQQCSHTVQASSHHCHTCDRCVQKFDHHCKYLNNCIGGKNYHSFIRLLITVTLFCITLIGQGIWVFAFASTSEEYGKEIISRWGSLCSIVFTFAMMIAVDSLLCFHCYLVLWLKTSTLKYLSGDNEATDSSKERIEDQIQ